jgi:phospholipid N-methyltransferase
MSTSKVSISLPSELLDDVREAARKAGVPLSAWLAEAAAAKVRSESLKTFLDEWEAKDGPFTEDELARAAQDLGLSPKAKSA